MSFTDNSSFHLKRFIDEDSNKLISYAWPGGYPIIYIDGFNSVICPDCANKLRDDPETDEKYKPVCGDVFSEGSSEFCAECNIEIESAYGDPFEEEEEEEEEILELKENQENQNENSRNS